MWFVLTRDISVSAMLRVGNVKELFALLCANVMFLFAAYAVCILSTMSAEVDNLVDRLKRRDLGRFVTLLEMHLSFLLDLPGSSLEAYLDGSHATDYTSPERFRGFGNFARKKSLKGYYHRTLL